MKLDSDGLLVRTEDAREAAHIIVAAVQNHGLRYGEGECGLGLYSPNYDRMWGEFVNPDEFVFNPQVLRILGMALPEEWLSDGRP